MASVKTDSSGFKKVRFYIDGKRRSISIGNVANRIADGFCIRVEMLLDSVLTGVPSDGETLRWLNELPDVMHARLAAVGLVHNRPERQSQTLARLVAAVREVKTVKESTFVAWGQAVRSLTRHFGEDCQPLSITPRQAAMYRVAMVKEGMAEATISKRIIVAKSVFRQAIKWGWLSSNPFDDVRPGSQCNDARLFYVSPEVIEAVIAEAPDAEWRALIALARYGGLRTPSESLDLKWGDVLWDKDRMVVHSSKTAHHEGGATRIVPLFPALRFHLEAAYHAAAPGKTYVVERYRSKEVNLRSQLLKVIERAGVAPWPRLWQNLRASCATDVASKHAAHLESAWLGHSTKIAQKHYLQPLESDFLAAAGTLLQSVAKAAGPFVLALAEPGQKAGPTGGPLSGLLGGPNPAPQASAPGGTRRMVFAQASADVAFMPLHAAAYKDNENQTMAPLGFEPRTKGL